nr:hypothetical protein [Tanacetum cinerariifolium]
SPGFPSGKPHRLHHCGVGGGIRSGGYLCPVADLPAVDRSRSGHHGSGADALRQAARGQPDHDVFCVCFRQHRYGQRLAAGG